MRNFKWLVPLTILLLLSGFLWRSLHSYHPEEQLMVVNQVFPKFQLSTIENPKILLNEEYFKGKISCLTVWASWCLLCNEQHQAIRQFYAKMPGVSFVGLNFHDAYQDAKEYLESHGNPYLYSLYDKDGRLAMDGGVSKIPELFIIDGKGVIRYRFRGPITQTLWYNEIQPKLQQLVKENL